jgi:hypothetical protein
MQRARPSFPRVDPARQPVAKTPAGTNASRSISKPPRSILLTLLVLALGAPLLAHASSSVVGAYSMFGHLERYHIEVQISGEAGKRQVSLRSLAPHLSRDAREMLLPADGNAIGADQVRLVAGGLGHIARLVCAARPDARVVHVRMHRGKMRSSVISVDDVRAVCEATR